jgi:DNA-binding response OmpR family regulator
LERLAPATPTKDKDTEKELNTSAWQSHLGALELADEACLSMPVAWTTLRTRIKSALKAGFGHRLVSHERYPATLEEGILTAGELRIDLGRREVTVQGRPIEHLKPRLFDLLVYFVRNPEVPLTSGQLMHNVWGYIPSARSRTLHIHIAWLREALEDDAAHPTLIQTIPHIGYRLAIPTKRGAKGKGTGLDQADESVGQASG